MTETALRQRFPEIAWDEPIKITVGGYERWVCRLCIATHGLKASDIDRVPYAFKTYENAVAHVRGEH
jgi:hypothetical protein